MTVLEVIQKSTDFLAKKGVESPRLQVELLLAHILKTPRMKLYLNFERVLATPELDELREFVKRRGNREPLQHIVGSVSFSGLELAVNRHVLIPRPETEMLAERAWTFVGKIAGAHDKPVVLDFGTGSGCLAIVIATRCPNAEVHAIDVSADTLAVARENAERHQVAGRIRFHQGDAFSTLPRPLTFDLIVTNPPYIPTAEIATLEPEVRDHDPRTALDGGADGLDFFRRLAIEAPKFMKAGGKLMAEFGDGQAPSIRRIVEEQGWAVESIDKDLNQRERFIVAHRLK